jgi:thioesterase domain-containing protein/acyl carrier protein
MVLSCRVLGRGVEHAMLAHLGRLARERGLAWVEAPFVATSRNQPAANFLHGLAPADRQPTATHVLIRFRADDAARTQYRPGEGADLQPADGAADEKAAPAQALRRDRSLLYQRISTRLCRTPAIHAAVEERLLASRPLREGSFVEPRTALQVELTGVWARLLHLDRVGIRDEFEALGGTSLIAAQLFAEIEERFGRQLPLTTILEAPTVECLAERIQGGQRTSLKLLKPGPKGGPVLFLVHDGEGETLLYLNLARRLPHEVTVYGLEPHGSDGCPVLHTHLAEMAAYYVRQMRETQAQGPYLVGGMCAGGVLAFEVAAQLRAAGQEVGLVVLLDAAAPRAARRTDRLDGRPWARLRQGVTAVAGGSALARLARKALLVARKARGYLWYRLSTRARWLANGLRIGLYRRGRFRWLLRGLAFRTVYQFAEVAYTPPAKLDAPVILFRATDGSGTDEPFAQLFQDPALGWREHAVRDFRVVDVAGGHSSMLQEPFVKDLAEQLRLRLERVGRTETV